jgi:hypothetical protein
MNDSIQPAARLLAVLALAALLAGCGKTPTTPISSAAQSNADDVAQQIGVSMAQDNGGMVSTYGATQAPAGGVSVRPVRTAEPTTAASDTTFSIGGITFTFTRLYLNELHNGMPTFDPVLTWGVVETSRATGSITLPQFSAAIGRAGTLNLWNVSVVAPDTLTANGTADDTTQCSFVSAFTGAQRYFYSVASGVMSDVRTLKPITTDSYPSSGTVTWTVAADRLRSNDRVDVESHFDALVVVSFNGTRYPDVTVNGIFRYRIDLKTGAVQRA